MEVHFRYSMELIDHASQEVEPARALSIYTRLHNLRAPDADTLYHKVFVALGRRRSPKPYGGDSPEQDPGAKTPQSIFGQIRRRLRGRVNIALREWVEYHTGRAETELLSTHVENSLEFVDLLEPAVGMAEAVALYAEELGLHPSRVEVIYFLGLASRSARKYATDPGELTPGNTSSEVRTEPSTRSLKLVSTRRGSRRREVG
jgi:hypothetical protein